MKFVAQDSTVNMPVVELNRRDVYDLIDKLNDMLRTDESTNLNQKTKIPAHFVVFLPQEDQSLKHVLLRLAGL